MATKRRRRVKKAVKKVAKRRVYRKKVSMPVAVPKSALASELSLLHKIDKKVSRIDRTVNAGRHLVRKAKKAKRRSELEQAWAEREEGGYE